MEFSNNKTNAIIFAALCVCTIAMMVTMLVNAPTTYDVTLKDDNTSGVAAVNVK